MDRRRQIRMTETEMAAAAKRVGIGFHPTRVSSWDHRKLG
jgi:hypothetical protein